MKSSFTTFLLLVPMISSVNSQEMLRNIMRKLHGVPSDLQQLRHQDWEERKEEVRRQEWEEEKTAGRQQWELEEKLRKQAWPDRSQEQYPVKIEDSGSFDDSEEEEGGGADVELSDEEWALEQKLRDIAWGHHSRTENLVREKAEAEAKAARTKFSSSSSSFPSSSSTSRSNSSSTSRSNSSQSNLSITAASSGDEETTVSKEDLAIDITMLNIAKKDVVENRLRGTRGSN